MCEFIPSSSLINVYLSRSLHGSENKHNNFVRNLEREVKIDTVNVLPTKSFIRVVSIYGDELINKFIMHKPKTSLQQSRITFNQSVILKLKAIKALFKYLQKRKYLKSSVCGSYLILVHIQSYVYIVTGK